MLNAITMLLVCQLAGEGLVHVIGLPVPGPVVGLVILALCLVGRDRLRGGPAPMDDTPLGRVAGGLLSHLSLLFVPAAVGVVQQGAVIASDGAAIAVALVASTLATLAVTALVFAATLRLLGRRNARP